MAPASDPIDDASVGGLPNDEPHPPTVQRPDASRTTKTGRVDELHWGQDADDRRPRIAMSPKLVAWVDDTCAAVLLSQIIYWSRRGAAAGRDGWIHKTAAQWLDETGLSQKQQARARKLLLDKRLIEERLCGMPARLEFRLQLSVVVGALHAMSTASASATDTPADIACSTAPFVSWAAPNHLHEVLGQLLGRSFLFEASLTRYMSVPAAMLASRLKSGAIGQPRAARSGHSSKDAFGGYLRLQRHDWRAETGLTRHQWETARRDLNALGLLRERQHNFPRRVDLALNLTAYAALLQQTGPAHRVRPGMSVEAGSVWAKQATQQGNSPNQPVVSPKPTCSAHPNQPARIAQTGLYLEVGLQGNYPQPQTRMQAHAAEAAQAPAQGVGDHQAKTTNTPTTLRFAWSAPLELVSVCWRPAPTAALPKGTGTVAPHQAPAASAAVTPTTLAPTRERADPVVSTPVAPEPAVSLVWPPCFEPADHAACLRYLASVDVPMQQTILDEIEWMHGQGKGRVRSPVALVRVLCKKALAGQFAADGAHRIASARRRRVEQAQARQLPQSAAPQPVSGKPSEQDRAKLAELKAQMQARRFGA